MSSKCEESNLLVIFAIALVVLYLFSVYSYYSIDSQLLFTLKYMVFIGSIYFGIVFGLGKPLKIKISIMILLHVSLMVSSYFVLLGDSGNLIDFIKIIYNIDN